MATNACVRDHLEEGRRLLGPCRASPLIGICDHDLLRRRYGALSSLFTAFLRKPTTKVS